MFKSCFWAKKQGCRQMMLNSMDVLSLLTYCASSALVTAAAYAQSHLLLEMDPEEGRASKIGLLFGNPTWLD